ncbi:hypothetical protein ASE96_04185 [Arthrobacter sp. Leaf69]|nr:hypothetical protein ASE96_04185 [Arthrobacter sp. Leaf69]
MTFLRAVHAEWLKLTSLRSSYIILTISLVCMVGVGLLSTFALTAMVSGFIAIDAEQGGAGQQSLVDEFGIMAREVPAAGTVIAQFLVASLAVMQIGSEYGTRMITTTLIAVPRRITAVLAKTLVIAGSAFAVGVVGALISYAVAQPLLEPHGLNYPLIADGVIRGIISAGAYLALIAVLGLSIGALLRNSAGGIVTILGILTILPILVAILSGLNDSFKDLGLFLPTSAGMDMVAIRTAQDHLTQVQGGLVVLAWAAVALAGALVTVKRRDA